jgi:hypothetical protein
MTAPTLDRRQRRVRREARQGTALLIATIILVVVALGAAGAALLVRRDTDDLHTRTEPMRDEVRKLTFAERDAETHLRLLKQRGRAASESLAALFAAEQAQIDASNHAVDVANQAVDQYNNAQVSDLGATFAAAGDAALGDLETKTTAARAAADAARRAIASLQGATDG